MRQIADLFGPIPSSVLKSSLFSISAPTYCAQSSASYYKFRKSIRDASNVTIYIYFEFIFFTSKDDF